MHFARRYRGAALPVEGCFSDCHQIASLWGLRILIHLGGYKRFESIMDELGALEALGLERFDRTPPASELKILLTAKLAEVEAAGAENLGKLGKNINLLARTLELNKSERLVLAFAVVLHSVSWLEDITRTLGELDTGAAIQVVTKILRVSAVATRRALDPEGALAASGILRLTDDSGDLKEKLRLLDSLAGRLVRPQSTVTGMLKPFFDFSDPTSLTREDYPHAHTEWNLLSEYLTVAVKEKRGGVNILLHGDPGTGKTHFVRALASALKFTLCEVASVDKDGDGLVGSARFSAYQLAERVLAKSVNHVLLFDEIEDVFPTESNLFDLMMRNTGSTGKAHINRALEKNPLPAFWLSNHIDQIDPAYLRRFDLIVEMPKLTRSVRHNILKHHLEGCPIDDMWLRRIAEHPDLTPADIQRASKVVKALDISAANVVQNNFEQVLRGSLEARGVKLAAATNLADNGLTYSLDYLNPDTDLARIRDGLKRCGRARLCLYGPPGTGKSAFGRHIAEALDRPLLLRRASDLLSMWLGGTEQNIAEMFREADREGAVLLLDEADSFLQDRSGAQRSWEVTQVNELLTRMEAFQGVFIASTNLMDNLDAASLRRFDFKVRFNYLQPAQREALFRDLLVVTGCSSADIPECLRERLCALDTLTPGDYAVTVRQTQLFDVPPTPDELVSVLEAECASKTRGKVQFLGFSGRA